MANNPKHALLALMACAAALVATSCSTTSSVPEGDQLYIGLTKVKCENYENSASFSSTQGRNGGCVRLRTQWFVAWK